MKDDNILQKASQHALSEVLGYDEARIYYLILIKKEKDIEAEFSYSKRYRTLKSLFNLGAVGKVKAHNRDFFSYIILPPSFLHAQNVDKSIIFFLENLYFDNHANLLGCKFSQMILKDEKGLILFMLKYIMKNEAKIKGCDLDLKPLKNDEKNKVIIKASGEIRRKEGVIDKRLRFEFAQIRDLNGHDYMGYISNGDQTAEITG